MALRQHKPNGNWYVYFRGSGGRWIERSTLTTDKRQARDIAAALMDKNRAELRQHRLERLLNGPVNAPLDSPTLELPNFRTSHVSPRLKLSELLDRVRRYRDISINHIRAWNRFAATLPKDIRYADQITPEIAFTYLCEHYGDKQGKSWNNNKTYLHSLFKNILLDAGLPESPFAKVMQRKNTPTGQRSFTETEAAAIIAAAPEPWSSASLIAYYTGLRQKDVFALRWNDIVDNLITVKPAKTAAFNRSVRIPAHPGLTAHLAKLPRVNDRVLGFSPLKCSGGAFTVAFGKILKSLQITDNSVGTVCFNSFRNTFITRCDAAQIPRHATRGIVGHVKDSQTDWYSDDIETAKLIQSLPSLKPQPK